MGLISFASGLDEDKVLEVVLERGADDIITNDDGSIDVITDPDNFVDTKEALIIAGFKPENAEITMRASISCDLDRKGAESMLKLLDMLEDLDDVQKVYSNAEISDDVMAELS